MIKAFAARFERRKGNDIIRRMTVRPKKLVVRLGHSPDPDDAFMWWPLFAVDDERPRIESDRFAFEPVPLDIERLNELSVSAELEVTAMSCAQFPRVQDRYVLTSCGASIGDGFGPKLVSRRLLSWERLRDSGGRVAVPGVRTSAFGALTLLFGRSGFPYDVVPFEKILGQVAGGSYDAGLVIHEGQLTYEAAGLHLIEDLGAWWKHRSGLPLPLGVNAVRRDFDAIAGTGSLEEIATVLRRSVEYSLAHRAESIAYSLRFARGVSASLADRFISHYVNHWTVDFGETGRRAVFEFLRELALAGLCPPLRADGFVLASPA